MKRALYVCLVTALAYLAPAAATTIDWEDGLWDNGSGPNAGYNNGAATGTTNGGTVTVDWDEFGGATGNHGSLGGAQPTVRTDFNGSSTDGALSIGTANDNNNSLGTLTRYVTLTFNFSSPVELLSFILGDVDRGSPSTWIDFVAVEGREGGAGGTLRTASYAINPSQHGLLTMFGNPGVRGTNGNVGFDSDDGNVGVTFDGPVDFIRLYFHQSAGVTGSGAEHGIWLQDIEYEEFESVPEPGTLALVGVGLVAAGYGKRKRR